MTDCNAFTLEGGTGAAQASKRPQRARYVSAREIMCRASYAKMRCLITHHPHLVSIFTWYITYITANSQSSECGQSNRIGGGSKSTNPRAAVRHISRGGSRWSNRHAAEHPPNMAADPSINSSKPHRCQTIRF